MSNEVKVIFGSMTFGKEGTLFARIHDVKEAGALLDSFQQHGHTELDTARGYGNGSCELLLSQLDLEKRGLKVATKIYPTARSHFKTMVTPYTHSAQDIRKGITDSLQALNAKSIDLFYLHAPDRETPFEETLKEVNALHKEGLFQRFGVSNYMAWEVAQMCEICKRNGWIQPSVYQGVYNCLQRSIEAELIPCLRKYNISFYAYQPLASGFLSGRYSRNQKEFERECRYDPETWQGKFHHSLYWNDAHFDALESIDSVAKKFGLTDAEVALRWLKHHSKLDATRGDGILVGASKLQHLEDNLRDLEKGKLPEEVVEAVDRAWSIVKGSAAQYWH